MTLAPPAIRVAVNDRQLPVVAVFEKGRVLVPFRAIVEALGGRVEAFHLPLPPPARIIAGRTYAPIRALANAMHAQIQYDAREHLVQVFTAHPVVASVPLNYTPSVTYTSVPMATPSPQPPNIYIVDTPYQSPLQLNVYQREIIGGDSLRVELTAPPGGHAFASVCTSSFEFPLYASPGSQYYSGSVPTNSVSTWIDCPITARYVGWNGAVSYAPYPVFVQLRPFATPQPTTQPTARPTATPQPLPPPRRIPLPPIRRATPKPTETPTAAPTAAPAAVPTDTPAPVPRRERFPISSKTPKPCC